MRHAHRHFKLGTSAPLLVACVASGCAPLVYWAGQPMSDNVQLRETEAAVSQQAKAHRFLAQVAALHPANPVQGVMYGERVLADFAAGGTNGCGDVLVTYQDLRHSQVWTVCSDGAVSRSGGAGSQLPDSPDFAAIRHSVTLAAWHTGRGEGYYADYIISAKASNLRDTTGCAVIENAVIVSGTIVDVRYEKICENS